MNRIVFLIIVTSLLVGCGLDSVPKEGLTNAANLLWWEKELANITLTNEILENGAGKVWTDMRPIAGTNMAQVTYRIEMEEDALKMGGEGPFYLYGGGLLQVQDDEAIFQEQALFSTEGEIQLRGFQPKPNNGQAGVVGWLGEPDNMVAFGKFGSLTKDLILGDQIIGLEDLVLVAVTTAGNETETNVLTNNENITEFTEFQCEGHMIPGSNQASLSYTAKTSDGNTLVGAGIGLLHNMPTAKSDIAFNCTMEGKGGIVYHAAVEGAKGVEGVKSAQIVDLVIEGVKVRTEDGQTSSIDMMSIYGFTMGDGGVPF